jgi:hypothetical protein
MVSRHIVSRGCHYQLCDGDFWHVSPRAGSFLFNNAFLGEGVVMTISAINSVPGLEKVVSPYGIKAQNDSKEQEWERIRRMSYDKLPSRINGMYLFDNKETAITAAQAWFPGENRKLLEAQIIASSRVARADARLLDCTQEYWSRNAHKYWQGEITSEPFIEIIVEGSVYFPGWKSPPFGIGAGWR